MLKLTPDLTLAVRPGETPPSFASRVALKSNISSRDLAQHCGIRYLDLVDGNPTAIATLARACLADPTAFRETTIRNVGPRRYMIGNEAITRTFLCRAEVRLCPTCIVEDMNGPDGRFGPYGRIDWLFDAVRACTVHHRLIVSLPHDYRPNRTHDFAFHVHNHLNALESLKEAAIPVVPSPLVTYVGHRVRNGAPDNWLSTMPLYAAAKASEVIGSAMLYGAHRPWKSLRHVDWHAAGGAGFDLLSQGPAALRSYFRDLQQERAAKNLGWAFKDTFGRIYDFLSHDSEDPGYEPLRDVLFEHIVDTVPVGPGDVVVGRPVTIRRLHSIHSASLETGIHVNTLRKQLKVAGVIDETSDGVADDLLIFSAADHGDLVRRLVGAEDLKGAAAYLNIPRPHGATVLAAGYVKPFLRPGTHGLGEYSFARDDLDAFLARLSARARPLMPGDDGFAWIGHAAKRACRPATQIVDLLFRGELENVRLQPDETGFKAILVQLDEVRQHLHPVSQGLTLEDVKLLLATSVPVVKALVDHGHLQTRTEINTVSRLPARLVEPVDLQAFMERYVSLHVLAREHDRHFLAVGRQLNRRGVKPIFDPDQVCATFYLRADLEPFLDELRAPNRK